MTEQKTILIADDDPELSNVIEQYDPILESIFSALGVDERYFDEETSSDAPMAAEPNVLASGKAKDQTGAQENVASASRSDSATASAKPWILHVDDDTDLSNALKIRLEAHGVSVVQAFDGLNGVRHAFTNPADLIILDYQLPHGNGDYVLRRLKQCSATRHIPIIVLTGRRDRALQQQLLQLGANRFLTKPIRFDSLLDELRQFVPLREPRGQACLMA